MAAVGDDWERDKFEDGSYKQVGEEHMMKMKRFVEQYADQLNEIESSIGETMRNGWDASLDPIGLNTCPFERTNVLELVKTKSKPLTKITAVFASLCEEIAHLKQAAENNFYPPLVLFGYTRGEPPLEGDVQVQLGRMFPLLLEMSYFVERCSLVTLNLVRQLAHLHHPKQNGYENLRFATMWKYLAQLFEVLISLDSILRMNTFLESLSKYKRMIGTLKKEPETYNIQGEESLWQFEKLMLHLKGILLDGKIFQNCIKQDFDGAGRFQVQNNPVFKKVFLSTITSYYKGLGTQPDSDDPRRYLRACTLFALYTNLFGDTDKKLLKDLWEINKHIPIVHIYANVTWDSCEFLTTNIPSKYIQGMKDLREKKRDYLVGLSKIFPSKVKEFYLRVSRWMILMESHPNRLKAKPNIISKGLAFAQAISELLKNFLYLHLATSSPIDPLKLPLIFQCFELLKSIQYMYHRRIALIAEAVTFMTNRIAFQMQQMLEPARVKLTDTKQKKTTSHANLDAYAAVILAMQMLNGPPTRTRAIIFQLAYHQVPPGLIEGGEEGIAERLAQLDNLANLGTYVDRACDTTVLYWAQMFLMSYVKYIYKNPSQAQKLPYLFSSLRDTIPLFHKSIHVPPITLIEDYKREIDSILKEEFIVPLCEDIHKDLAESIHHSTKNLEVSRKLEQGPFKQKDLSLFLQVRPLRYYDLCVDIPFMVTHFLDRMFYNLNTVALYDWATFGEMRSLAQDKYGLFLKEVHLPGQTLEQGILDILEIMRKLPSFVINYRYNLNNQIFIEAQSQNNTLDAITVMHIANSIRTHGTGIMNTAVSVTFQFLKDCFHKFSQFLFDEMIKSRLFRDAYAFNEQKKESKDSSTPYSFSTAKKLQEYIRGIGTTKDKKTYLDKFRQLITEIGNAMGYVRLIRSGGLLYTSNAIQFVPDLTEIEKFEELSKTFNLPPHIIQAGHNLDAVVDTLYQNFSEGSEYFKMLVNVFATEYRRSENSHLENFYLIVPALTLEYIQQIGIDKEKFSKKGRETGVFTDDGFALGIAFILKLLNQNRSFDSLVWFSSATEFLQSELETKNREKDNIKITQLTKAKISGDLEEFRLLHWSFASARILFHD